MLLFPHNSMFAYSAPGTQQRKVSTYAVRLNDSLVKTTSFFYWKKDFIESSLASYARYEESNRQVYLQQYFQHSGILPEKLQKNMLPEEKEAIRFLPWLLNYAGCNTGNDTKISLYRYNFTFTDSKVLLQDSLLILSQKITRR